MQNNQPNQVNFNDILVQQVAQKVVETLNGRNITGHNFFRIKDTIIDRTDGLTTSKQYKIERQLPNNTFSVSNSDNNSRFNVHSIQELVTAIEGNVYLERMTAQEIAARTVNILNSRNIPNHLFTASHTGVISDAYPGGSDHYRVDVHNSVNGLNNVLVHKDDGRLFVVQNLNDLANKIIRRM